MSSSKSGGSGKQGGCAISLIFSGRPLEQNGNREDNRSGRMEANHSTSGEVSEKEKNGVLKGQTRSKVCL